MIIISRPASLIIEGVENDFVISTGKSVTSRISVPAEISVTAPAPGINTTRNKVSVLDIAEVCLISNVFNIRTTSRKVISTTRSLKRQWQARLGSKMDSILKKSIDNKISLSSYPIDMVRVKVNREEKTQDLISRSVVANEIISLYFETALTDLPLRRMEYSDTEQIILTVDGTKLEEIKVKCPISHSLSRDDLLFRIIRDDYSERPVVLVLQVKEELGTIGYSKLIQINYILSYYDEKLPEEVLAAIIDNTLKREEVQW